MLAALMCTLTWSGLVADPYPAGTVDSHMCMVLLSVGWLHAHPVCLPYRDNRDIGCLVPVLTFSCLWDCLCDRSGWTICRQRNGSLWCRGTSPLPGGSPATQGSSEDGCVLDVIFHEADSSCYCLDVMMWRGYSLYEAGAECRLFWLDSKLREEGLLGLDWEAVLAGPGPGAAAGVREGTHTAPQQQQEPGERGGLPTADLQMLDAAEQQQQQQQQGQNGHQQQRPQQMATFRCVLRGAVVLC